jgi:hypothetical protein
MKPCQSLPERLEHTPRHCSCFPTPVPNITTGELCSPLLEVDFTFRAVRSLLISYPQAIARRGWVRTVKE